MEFLVEFEVPAGTPDAEVEQHQRAESAAAAKLTATPPPRRRFACATPGSRAATRSSAQTAL